MSHLNAETLARLVDDPPDALEAAHLAGCASCRAQLDAMRDDVRALGALGPIEPHATAWDALHERLLDEGLVRTTRRRVPAYMQIAAALALFLAGTAAGFTWRGATLPPQVAAVSDDPTAPDSQAQDETRGSADAASDAGTQRNAAGDAPRLASDTRASADAPAAASSDDVVADTRGGAARVADTDPRSARAGDAPAGDPRTPRADGETRVADVAPGAPSRSDDAATQGEPRITGPLPADPRFALLPYGARNAQEAATMLRDAEGMYLDALAQYAQLSGDPRDMEDPVARLVALESIVLSTREALDRAPADPIINGYHMTAVAQRDATLRQLAARGRNPQF